MTMLVGLHVPLTWIRTSL